MGIRNVVALNFKLEGFAQDFSFAVQDGNKDLLAKLNEGLALIIANGTYEKLHKKWFSPIDSTTPDFGEIIRLVLLLLVPTTILIALAAILILQRQVKIKTKSLVQEISFRKNAEAAIQKQLQEKELLIKEAHHRIKNNFSSISALLSLQAENVTNPEALAILNEAIGRVNSMVVLYENLLLKDDYQNTSIKTYLENLLREIMAFFPKDIPVSLEQDLADFQISPHYLFSIGLIVNELMTNIGKYAFVGRTSGHIIVRLAKNGSLVSLSIADDGIGMPGTESGETKPGTPTITASQGFGLTLVGMLAERINATIRTETVPGTRTTLVFSYGHI
jgi:two-component sensor histidine kinase